MSDFLIIQKIEQQIQRRMIVYYTLTQILRSLWGLLNFFTRFFTIFLLSNGTAISSLLQNNQNPFKNKAIQYSNIQTLTIN